ncbi:MAG: hypothetical protein CMB56_007465 [Methanobacteriota archaeon]|nr:MAG: hypothetical protein CMB56_007465 [Euryarchaeota archaeon]|tara:strand:- start:6028 stop:7011 length:984 start_codon:yes stop_codon:yes gene_type:complete
MDSNIKKGILFSFILGMISYLINSYLRSNNFFSPGAGTIAFLLGVISGPFFIGLKSGGKYTIERVLPVSIILIGFGLNLEVLFNPNVGLLGILLIFASTTISFVLSIFIGRLFKMDSKSSLALGAGCAICGNSAVMAVSPSLKLKEDQVAVIIATINILGFLSFILIPILSDVIGMTQQEAGIWIGTVVHAVPQTIAAGESIGSEALIIATLLKLSRVTLLVLVVPLCAIIGNAGIEKKSSGRPNYNIPIFIYGFVISSVACTFLFPSEISELLFSFGKILLIPVMVSVGFFTNWSSFKNSAPSAIYVGTITTLTVIVTTFIIISVF